MGNSSQFDPPLPKGPESQWELGDLAEPADIPQPRRNSLEEELGAQARRKEVGDFGTLPRNLLEAVQLVRRMEEEGRRVEKSTGPLMDYLKKQQGDAVSADLLTATAMLMAAIPQGRKKKRRSLLRRSFRWIREKSSLLVLKVLRIFKT